METNKESKPDVGQEQDQVKKQKRKMDVITTCLIIGVLIVGFFVPPVITATSNAAKKELPIYCVDTKKPQIALSFDAAWVAYRLRR